MDDRLGFMLGLQDAAKTIGSRVAHANGQVDKAQRIVDDLYAENQALEDKIKKLKLALVVEQAHAAGLKAKLRGFVQVVGSELPGTKLVQKTGLRYPDGSEQKFGDRLYDDGFDALISERGLKNKFRDEAK